MNDEIEEYEDEDDPSLHQAQVELAEEYESALGRALRFWSRGQHIPMDLFSELVELGFDVPTLEAKHFRY